MKQEVNDFKSNQNKLEIENNVLHEKVESYNKETDRLSSELEKHKNDYNQTYNELVISKNKTEIISDKL